jgi:hypothetical protein
MADENVETQVTEETESTEETSDGMATDSDNDSGGDSSEETTEAEGEEGSGEEDDLSPDDVALAKSLMRALRDPSKNVSVIKNLATTLGIELGGSNVKSETKAVDSETGKKRTIAQLVDENLPPEWKRMAPVMTALLENFQAQYVEDRFKQTTEEKHNERSNAALAHMAGKYKDYKAVEPRMLELAKDLQPGALRTQDDYNRYLERLYVLAKGTGEGNLNSKISQALGKAVDNAKRAKPGPSDVSRVKQDVVAKTPAEAVRMAMRQLSKK